MLVAFEVIVGNGAERVQYNCRGLLMRRTRADRASVSHRLRRGRGGLAPIEFEVNAKGRGRAYLKRLRGSLRRQELRSLRSRQTSSWRQTRSKRL